VHHIALYTFGVLKSAITDPTPLTREFQESGGGIYREVGGRPGYIAHAEAADRSLGASTDFDADWGSWGEFVVPSWYDKGRTAETIALAATLSLWTDLRSAFDFIYTGIHRTALNRRSDWFERTGFPGHVFWWVTESTIPTWQEGVAKLEHLHTHTPEPHAFTFHHSFDATGHPAGLRDLTNSPTSPGT
jgi:uncharacterized protein DUF3291